MKRSVFAAMAIALSSLAMSSFAADVAVGEPSPSGPSTGPVVKGPSTGHNIEHRLNHSGPNVKHHIAPGEPNPNGPSTGGDGPSVPGKPGKPSFPGKPSLPPKK